MPDGGEIPWKVWAVVSILIAIIGLFGSIFNAENQHTQGTEVAENKNNISGFFDKIGIYSGHSSNAADIRYGGFNIAEGMTILDLEQIDPKSGDVNAYIHWYRPLMGEGDLFGTIDKTGLLHLSGDMGNWSCQLEGTFNGNILNGTYTANPKLGNTYGTQYGQFELIHQNF